MSRVGELTYSGSNAVWAATRVQRVLLGNHHVQASERLHEKSTCFTSRDLNQILNFWHEKMIEISCILRIPCVIAAKFNGVGHVRL